MKACLHFDREITLVQHGELVEVTVMMGCSGTGRILAGVTPLKFADCIVCRGTGFTEGSPSEPATIRCHSIGTQVGPSHVFEFEDFDEGSMMAHVMAKAGIFPSVSQARKNGWNKPLERGEWFVTKKKIKVTVQ